MVEHLSEVVNLRDLDLRYINRDQTRELFQRAGEVQFNAHVASGKINTEGIPAATIKPPEHKLDVPM